MKIYDRFDSIESNSVSCEISSNYDRGLTGILIKIPVKRRGKKGTLKKCMEKGFDTKSTGEIHDEIRVCLCAWATDRFQK